jgi:prevent-host-death family protein
MSEIINIQEAKTHLSRYIEDVAAGKELILGKAGKPLARLIPYRAPSKPRTLGLLAGKTWEADDAWSREVDATLEAELYGEEPAADRTSTRVAKEGS